jgi:hypothetical protein
MNVLLYSPAMRASLETLMFGLIEQSYITFHGFDDFLVEQERRHNVILMGKAWLSAFRDIDWAAARNRVVPWSS